MSIFRVEKNKNYTVISNYHLRDKNLSLKAIGLLSLILSLPDNWDYSQAGLAAICKDGEDSIRSGLKELEKFGYLERERERDESGRVRGVIYRIFEVPKELHDQNIHNKTNLQSKKSKTRKESPVLEEPILENPIQVDPSEGNQPQINKEIINTKKINTESTNLSCSTGTSFNQLNDQEDGRWTDDIEKRNALKTILQENIGYSVFELKNQKLLQKLSQHEIGIHQYNYESAEYDMKTLDLLIDAMLDILLGENEDPMKIGELLIPRKLVQAKLMKVDFLAMKHVVGFLSQSDSIKNKKKYGISMLYNQ